MAKDRTVFGLFDSRGGLEAAVDALRGAGFRADDISVLGAEPRTTHELVHEINSKAPEVLSNLAVAVAFADGPERGLELVERIEGLEGYHLFHSARADLLRRLGRLDEAAASYREALLLADEPLERRFLERRLAEVAHSPRV